MCRACRESCIASCSKVYSALLHVMFVFMYALCVVHVYSVRVNKCVVDSFMSLSFEMLHVVYSGMLCLS